MKTTTNYSFKFVFLVLSFLFIGLSSSYAQFSMGNTLAPLPGSLYPIIYSNDAKGGFHQVATIADRNAIPALRRQLGMICTVLDAGSGITVTYQLLGGLLDANWVKFAAGSADAAAAATTTGITNDVSKIESVFPTWVTDNTGNLPHYVSSAKLSFVPSTGVLTAGGIVKSGGVSSEFLKADGSVDTNTYLTSSSGVSSITGTSNQINASGNTGNVSLSLNPTITGLTSVTSTEFVGDLTGNATTATSFTGNLSGDVTGNQGTTIVGMINGKNIVLGGNLTTSGAFATTLTATAPTAVTLPTTGTLATLEGVETVSGLKTFQNSTIAMLGSSTGVTTLSSANTSVSPYSITLPAATGTVALTSDIPIINGVLYQGLVADLSTFNGLSWSDITSANVLGTSIPSVICSLDASKYTWIAFPKVWGSQNFFYQYGSPLTAYIVLDGFEKRMIPAASTGSIDYQIWVFKITPNIPVSLIANNN